MNLKMAEIESSYFSIISYMKEIDLLMRWKVIPLGSFHKIHPKKMHKTYSYLLADKLVKAGLAHKINCSRSNLNVLIPTQRVLDYTNSNLKPQFSDYIRYAFIAAALIELSVFRNKVVRFRHEECVDGRNSKKLFADFTLEGVDSKLNVFLAGVFFEPPHFSQSNSYESMMRYVDKGDFDILILIFKSLNDLHKRRELYFENGDHKYGKDLRKYICLVCIDDYLKHPHEINKSYVYFQNEETTLEKLFK